MNDLNFALRERAVSLGLCHEWKNDWKENKDQDELVRMFVRGIDFCIYKDYPGNDFIEKNFDREVLHRNGVYVNEKVDIVDYCGIVVLNGCCRGIIDVGGFGACTVHVRHDSDVVVKGSGMARIFVSVYDRTRVHATQAEGSRVYIYEHGDDCVICAEGDVRKRKIDQTDFERKLESNLRGESRM